MKEQSQLCSFHQYFEHDQRLKTHQNLMKPILKALLALVSWILFQEKCVAVHDLFGDLISSSSFSANCLVLG